MAVTAHLDWVGMVSQRTAMTGSTAPLPAPAEPKRIRQLRDDLVKALPKFPNDRPTRDALLAMPLGQLLIHYCNWRLRFIRRAQRNVTLDNAVTADPRYAQLQPAIEALLAKARDGEDLTPHLSLGAISKGYTLAASNPYQPPPAHPVDRWADKDFLLNVMGYHHLHLGPTIEPAGHVTRTNEVLFVQVTRNTFEAVALFDHSVFDDADPNGTMTPERDRLWSLFSQRNERGIPPGTAYVVSMVATSGHPTQLTMHCMQLARCIRFVESRLDDPSYVDQLYTSTGVQKPVKPKLGFKLNDLDLGLIDRSSNTFFVLQLGWI